MTVCGPFIHKPGYYLDARRKTLIRPISARYMHQKEIDHYESQT